MKDEHLELYIYIADNAPCVAYELKIRMKSLIDGNSGKTYLNHTCNIELRP